MEWKEDITVYNCKTCTENVLLTISDTCSWFLCFEYRFKGHVS